MSQRESDPTEPEPEQGEPKAAESRALPIEEDSEKTQLSRHLTATGEVTESDTRVLMPDAQTVALSPSTPAGSTACSPVTSVAPQTGLDPQLISRPFSQPSLEIGKGPNTGPLPADSIIAGRYRVIRVLGVGGMGEVYHVRDEALEIEVALKVMRSGVSADDSFLQRFRNELLVARQITHPNVVRIHDLGQDGSLIFMTMDLVEGRSLGDLMATSGAIPHQRAVEIIRQVVGALAASHQKGVVHRDLKPANILLDDKGDAFVTDFGIARSHNFSGLTRTGEVLGTPDYLAPEQARGEEVDGRTDIYALGLIFFEMVSGKRPFVGGTLYEILAQHMNGQTRTFQELGVPISPGLEALISRCLAPERSERYATAEALLLDLEDLGRPEQRKKQERRRRQLREAGRRLVFATAATVLAGGGWWAWTTFKPEAPPVVAPGASETASIPDLHSVLILPLSIEGESDPELTAWAEVGMPDQLGRMMSASDSLRVVSASRVSEALRNLELPVSSLSDADVGFLADLFAAERVLFGRLDPVTQGSLDGRGEPPQQASWRMTLESLSWRAAKGAGEEGAGNAAKETIFQGQAPSTDPSQLIRDATELLTGSLGVPALSAPALTTVPSALTDYYLARIDSMKEDSAAAESKLERAVELDPVLTPAWVALAELRQAEGRGDEALVAAERAVAGLPAEESALPSPMGHRANSLLATLQGKPERAVAELEAWLDRWPGEAAARLDLALLYGNQGLLDQAIEHLEILRRLDPTNSQAWYFLGRYTIVSGDPERAVDDYLVEAVSQARRAGDAQGEAQILNALGIGYQHLGKVEQASRRYADAAEIHQRLGDRNGYAKAELNLGNLSMGAGRLDDAEQQLLRAQATFEEIGNPSGQADAVNMLGLLRERQGRYDDALGQYRQALRLRLEAGDRLAAAESYYNVGFAYLEMANYTDAGLNLEQALGIYRELGNDYGVMLVLQSRASASIARGEWESAQRDLLDALATSRQLQIPLASAASHGSLGKLAAYQGRYQDAFSAFDKAIEIVEKQENLQGRVEFTLARIEVLLELGASAQAAEHLDQVVAWLDDAGNSSQRAQLRRLQGESALLAGDLETAEQRFQEAIHDAEASHSAATLLAARLSAASADPSRLEEALAEAKRLGHVPLELLASEALAAAQLNGKGLNDEGRQSAAETLRRALGLVRKLGDYGRRYRLQALQAAVEKARNNEDAGGRSLKIARQELERLRSKMPADLKPYFDQLPAVVELEPLSEQRGL